MQKIVLTEQVLSDNVKGLQFHPNKRSGLCVLKGCNQVSVQVRESKYHHTHESKGKLGHSWHDIKEFDFLMDKGKVDFYIFLTYLTSENKFVIVPAKDLEKLIKNKPSGQNEIYRFYFHFERKEVFEIRDEIIDYSKYLNRWDLIKNILEQQGTKKLKADT